MLCVSVLQPAGPPLTAFPMLLSRLAGHMEEGPDLDLGNSHQTPSRGCGADICVLVRRAAVSPQRHFQLFCLFPSFLHSQTAGKPHVVPSLRELGGLGAALELFRGACSTPRALSLPVTGACLEVLHQPSSIGKGGWMSLCGSPGDTEVFLILPLGCVLK